MRQPPTLRRRRATPRFRARGVAALASALALLSLAETASARESCKDLPEFERLAAWQGDWFVVSPFYFDATAHGLAPPTATDGLVQISREEGACRYVESWRDGQQRPQVEYRYIPETQRWTIVWAQGGRVHRWTQSASDVARSDESRLIISGPVGPSVYGHAQYGFQLLSNPTEEERPYSLRKMLEVRPEGFEDPEIPTPFRLGVDYFRSP